MAKTTNKKLNEHFGGHCGAPMTKGAVMVLIMKAIAMQTEILASLEEKVNMLVKAQCPECGEMHHPHPPVDQIPPYAIMKKKMMAAAANGGECPVCGAEGPEGGEVKTVVIAKPVEDVVTEGVDVSRMSTSDKLRKLGIDFSNVTHSESQGDL